MMAVPDVADIVNTLQNGVCSANREHGRYIYIPVYAYRRRKTRVLTYIKIGDAMLVV